MSLFTKTKDEGDSVARTDRISPSSTEPVPKIGLGRPEGTNQMANIGKSISIKGDLTGNEDLVLEGRVEGKVDLPNNQLTVGANGVVTAEIQAKAVVVIGRVTGNIQGTERIEIQATGVVDGDVESPRLLVAEGAVLNGGIRMSQKSVAKAPAPQPQPLESAKAS